MSDTHVSFPAVLQLMLLLVTVNFHLRNMWIYKRKDDWCSVTCDQCKQGRFLPRVRRAIAQGGIIRGGPSLLSLWSAPFTKLNAGVDACLGHCVGIFRHGLHDPWAAFHKAGTPWGGQREALFPKSVGSSRTLAVYGCYDELFYGLHMVSSCMAAWWWLVS